MPSLTCFRKCHGCATRRCSLFFSPMDAGCRKFRELRGKPFPNDHLDLFFNATVDAAIVMTTFLRAAEAVGLGCCPISVIRDHAAVVSEMFGFARKSHSDCRHVSSAGRRNRAASLRGFRSGQRCTKSNLQSMIFRPRLTLMTAAVPACGPIAISGIPGSFGRVEFYGWSEDKARQYAVPLRADFGAFVRAKGFHLD